MELSSKMHKKSDIFFVMFLCLVLNGCSAYVDARREAGVIHPVGQSRTPNIAICYNPVFNEMDQVDELAKKTCDPQKASYQNKKYFNCSLFYPNTAFYKCE